MILAIFSLIILVIFLFFYVFKSIPMWGDQGEQMAKASGPKNEFTIEGRLQFMNPAGDSITSIAIEIADEPYSREKGLMYRYLIPDTVGMLFIFPREDYRSFWMKNTPSSLDIMYANKNRKIFRIYEDTQPYSEASIPSGDPARYVIEVGAGFTARHGIKNGDTFDYTEFNP